MKNIFFSNFLLLEKVGKTYLLFSYNFLNDSTSNDDFVKKII